MRSTITRTALLITVAAGLAQSTFADEPKTVFRFDMGSPESNVAQGFDRVTPRDVYSPARGYGWIERGLTAVSHDSGFPVYSQSLAEGQLLYDYFVTLVNPLNQDSIVSENDLVFQIDVPPGAYRVSTLIGDLSQHLGSISLYLNDELKEKNIAAWHPGTTGFGNHRRILQDPWGGWNPVRHTVDARDGQIRIKLVRDQTDFDRILAEQTVEEKQWEEAYAEEYLDNPPYKRVGIHVPPYYYCGWPFVRNSLMALEIVPDKLPPVVAENDTLRLTRKIESPELIAAIEEYNNGDFNAALENLRDVKAGPEAQAAKATMFLWLAGRLETEFETDQRLVHSAIEILEPYVTTHPEEVRLGEQLEDAKVFSRAWKWHTERTLNATYEANHFMDNTKAIALWFLIKEGTPLYYQSQLHIVRAEHMLIPYFPARGTYREIAKQLQTRFPENRFVKYHLTGKWEPYGDGTRYHDWFMTDYSGKVADSPEWVKAIFPAMQSSIDWSEWWIRFKQLPDGSIGGGWSDDVEVVGAFGYHGYLSSDISELLVNGTAQLVSGLWNNSVDQELGFSQPLTDAEHSSEETGNTLGMMVQIDYGNPIWIERSMKTAKLIRDLWTEFDVNGHRRFRSHFFCASRVSQDPKWAFDAFINYRAIRPALAIYWYNQNPTIGELMVELADGWLASAMSTARGKPKGVIPGAVTFPDAIIGGVDSKTWYDRKPGGGYKPYVLDVLYCAFQVTKDPKYLEPIRFEYELARKYNVLPKSESGLRLQFVCRPLEFGHWKYDPQDVMERHRKKSGAVQIPEGIEEGGEEWTAYNIKMTDEWLSARRLLHRRNGPLINDITKQDIINSGLYCQSELHWRWPINTTEAGPTDRIGYFGFANPFLIYTGGRWGGPFLEAAVTYENTTRDFAAAVLASDPQGLRILYHSLTDDEREIGILPWHLEAGGTYRITYGPDADEDQAMDNTLVDDEIHFPQRGFPLRVRVKPRLTYVIEIDQTQPPVRWELSPDPALNSDDIKISRGGLMARVHNVGSASVRDVEVAFYDGDPQMGGTYLGQARIPHIEAPLDLDSKSTTVAIGWWPEPEKTHEIYVVIDPEGKLKGTEITTFNNVAHAKVSRDDDRSAHPDGQWGTHQE